MLCIVALRRSGKWLTIWQIPKAVVWGTNSPNHELFCHLQKLLTFIKKSATGGCASCILKGDLLHHSAAVLRKDGVRIPVASQKRGGVRAPAVRHCELPRLRLPGLGKSGIQVNLGKLVFLHFRFHTAYISGYGN